MIRECSNNSKKNSYVRIFLTYYHNSLNILKRPITGTVTMYAVHFTKVYPQCTLSDSSIKTSLMPSLGEGLRDLNSVQQFVSCVS